MDLLKAMGLFSVILLTFFILRVAEKPIIEEEQEAEVEEEIVIVRNQIALDVQKFCEEKKEDTRPSAPYEFIGLSDEYQIYLETRCIESGVDFFYVVAIMNSESGFDADAVSADGRDIGLMQIRDINFDYLQDAYGLDPHDPYQNMECGLLMIKQLMDKYSEEQTIQCYKCGEYGGIDLWDTGYRHPLIKEIMEKAEEWRLQAYGINRVS